MLRAMYTSITGLRNHQTMLDVTGNNIANVNTYGFKASNAAFKTLLTQTMQGAGAPSPSLGGTNNMQVGLGMTVDSISQRFTQGALQTTGVQTDLALQGDGFFMVSNDNAGIQAGAPTTSYTRAGNFTFDAAGTLVTSDGYFVLGYGDGDAAPGFQLDLETTTTPTTSPLGQINVRNLPNAVAFPNGTLTDPIVDSNGQVTAFYNDGVIDPPVTNPPGPAATHNTPINNTRIVIGQVALARFANPAGLTQTGSNRWEESLNSGQPVNGVANQSGFGSLAVGYLEMSNVDLATEFTEMIKAQRGFQANSRVITTSDEILQELVNLKR